MYFLNLGIIILKGILIVINNFIFSELSFFHLFYFILFYLIYIFLTSYEKNIKIYYSAILNGTKDNLTEHILKYRFQNNFRILIAIYIVGISLFIYVLGIFSLRIKNINSILDIKNIKEAIINLYQKLPILVFILDLILIIVFFFLLIKILEILKKRFLELIIKLHIYFSVPESWYQKTIDKLAFSNFVYKIKMFFFLLNPKISFFIYKENWNDRDIFSQKYQYIFKFISNLVNFIIDFGYFIILILLIIFDIFINNMVLIYTFHYLPIMFLYNLYLNYCNFVLHRRPFGLISYVNRLFYGRIQFVNDEIMLIDGLPHEIDENFGNDFLDFELNNFKIK